MHHHPTMASNFKSLLHQHYSHLFHHTIQSADPNGPPPTVFLHPAGKTNPFALTVNVSPSSRTSAVFATSTTPSTSHQALTSFDVLEQCLASQNFRQADEETRRLLIALSGEAAVKRGYVFFSEVQFIPAEDLAAIDELWRKYSDNKFGYSVQRRVWRQKANEDFSRFFLKVGWMKKLDTEVEQFNYRSFPNEFIWELDGDTPEGHLPLTNALRGTQLLNSIFTHPAFAVDDGGEEGGEEGGEAATKSKDEGSAGGVKEGSKPLSKMVFKTDYSF